STTAATASHTPPASICAPELIDLDAGSGTLRVSTDPTDQLNDATSSAAALVSTTAPASPIASPAPSRHDMRWVPSIVISASTMNNGIMACMTAVTPDSI